MLNSGMHHPLQIQQVAPACRSAGSDWLVRGPECRVFVAEAPSGIAAQPIARDQVEFAAQATLIFIVNRAKPAIDVIAKPGFLPLCIPKRFDVVSCQDLTDIG